MPQLDFPEIIELIYKEDTRYAKKAYDFVRLGLDYTVKELRKRDSKRTGKTSHVSGPELLHGMRAYALEQFGPMAKTVLKDWGITGCRDFGAIVYNLIEYNVFSKSAEDRLEDFNEVYQFEEAFTEPFLPQAKLASRNNAKATAAAHAEGGHSGPAKSSPTKPRAAAPTPRKQQTPPKP